MYEYVNLPSTIYVKAIFLIVSVNYSRVSARSGTARERTKRFVCRTLCLRWNLDRAMLVKRLGRTLNSWIAYLYRLRGILRKPSRKCVRVEPKNILGQFLSLTKRRSRQSWTQKGNRLESIATWMQRNIQYITRRLTNVYTFGTLWFRLRAELGETFERLEILRRRWLRRRSTRWTWLRLLQKTLALKRYLI